MSTGSKGIHARLQIRTRLGEDGKTYPAEVFYSAPYKLTNYFRLENGGIEYTIMNASAGVMAHDRYHMTIEVASGTALTISAQSFEKIHKMDTGEACRTTVINIASGGSLNYLLLPAIPFADSAFSAQAKIVLEDNRAQLLYLDIIGSGRHLRGERFNYRYFKSRTEIWRYQRPLYIDNSHFDPATCKLAEIGMFEGYNYVGNLIIYGYAITPQFQQQLRELLADNSLDGALTELTGDGYLLRLMSDSGYQINEFVLLVSRLLQ